VSALAPFTKTWHIRNVGTCTWTTGYKLVFVRGTKMGAPDSVMLPVEVLPGHSINLSVNFIAPNEIGTYESYWMLQAPDGLLFGVGSFADKPIWIKVKVNAPATVSTTVVFSPLPVETMTFTATPTLQPENVAYDFVANACLAQWSNNEQSLPCPGLDGDSRGFILFSNQAQLENGITFELPTLNVSPSSSANGDIQGIYPEYEVQAGDHLRALVGCENGYTSCSVLFRVAYQDASGTASDLWGIGEFYDGQYLNLDLDLSFLAGRKVQFILSVSTLGNSEGDRALWVDPRIVHLWVPTITLEPSATITPTETIVPASPTHVSTPTMSPIPTSTPLAEDGGPDSPSMFKRFIDFIISLFQNLFGTQ
jgi:hypothetical protein